MLPLTPAQIRAARGLLDWSLDDLVAASGISRPTLNRIESGAVNPHDDTMIAIRAAFESRDIQFAPNDGVSRQFGMIDRLSGENALNRFLDDVYETVKNGGSISVSGVSEKMFDKFHIEEQGPLHSQRMTTIKDKVSCRVLLKEGDFDFTYGSYIEYRWMPRDKFTENSFYVYGHKLAFLKFSGDDLEIIVITMPSAAIAFRELFEIVWENAKIPPRKKDNA